MYSAFIFDFDGVIVDSEQYWRQEENSAFSTLLPVWGEDDHKQLVGLSVHGAYRLLTEKYGLQVSPEEFDEQYLLIAERVYERSQLMPGLESLLSALQQRDIFTGIASSSRRRWINAILIRFEIAEFFQAVACSEDIEPGEGKPAPALFLQAAEKLCVPPAQCIAIEDAMNGVTAAKAAGMHCIGFRNGMNEAQDLSKADQIIESLSEIDVATLLK